MLLLLGDMPYKSFGHRLRTAFLVLGIPITILTLLPVLVVFGQDLIGFLSTHRTAAEHHDTDFLDTVVYLIPIAGVGVLLVLQNILAQHLHVTMSVWQSPLRAWSAIFAATAGGLSALLWAGGAFHWHELAIIILWELLAVEEGMRWFHRRRDGRDKPEEGNKRQPP